jgi:hypothetical protein
MFHGMTARTQRDEAHQSLHSLAVVEFPKLMTLDRVRCSTPAADLAPVTHAAVGSPPHAMPVIARQRTPEM